MLRKTDKKFNALNGDYICIFNFQNDRKRPLETFYNMNEENIFHFLLAAIADYADWMNIKPKAILDKMAADVAWLEQIGAFEDHSGYKND